MVLNNIKNTKKIIKIKRTKNRNWLIISPNETQDESVFIIESDTKLVNFGSNKISG